MLTYAPVTGLNAVGVGWGGGGGILQDTSDQEAYQEQLAARICESRDTDSLRGHYQPPRHNAPQAFGQHGVSASFNAALLRA